MRAQMNILFICPSEYWSTVERTALRDCKLLKEEGHNVFLYCLQDSYLDLQAKKHQLKTIPHPGRFSTSFMRWRKLGHLTEIFDKYKIEIVQCYDIHMLWPVSFYLRNRPLMSLIFSHNVEIQKNYRQVWYRPLVTRIDVTLIPNREMVESVVGALGVPPHKVEDCGLGVGEERLYEEQDSNPDHGHFLANFSDDWLMGCYIGAHEKKIKFLYPLFHALKVLKRQRPLGRTCKLVLISDKPWDQSLIYPELRNYLVDNGLDQDVLFESKTPVIKLQRWMDLWVGVRSFEAIEDYTVTALLGGLPVVLTRSTTSMELIRQNPGVGHTYKRYDSRELRVKIADILENREDFTKKIENSYERLKEQFGVETYKDKLIKIFSKSLSKRLRFYRKKKLSGRV